MITVLPLLALLVALIWWRLARKPKKHYRPGSKNFGNSSGGINDDFFNDLMRGVEEHRRGDPWPADEGSNDDSSDD